MSEENNEYEPNQTDEYVNHLADVQDTHPATASEDILNEHGVLLLKKGAVINQKVAGHLVQHKLKKELDQSISVANPLTVYDILNQILELVESESELNLLHQHFEFEVTLRQLLFVKPIPAPILQRLTVMQEVMPDFYKRSLFCAWMAPLLAKIQDLPHQSYFSAFAAGLSHDIGLLHIPVEAATKQEGLTYQQWRALKTHPIVARIILEGRKIYDEDVLSAVADHQERCDRSGYPAQKPAKEINWAAPLVGLADQLFDIFYDKERTSRTILTWNAYLEVNMSTFGVRNVEALLAVLKEPKISSHVNKALPEVNVGSVSRQNEQVHQLFDMAVELFDISSDYPRSRIARGVSECITQLRWVRDSAGMGSEHLSEWLDWGEKNKDQIDQVEMSEISELLTCLRWRFRHLRRLAVELSWNDKLPAEDKARIEVIYKKMQPLLPRPGLIDPEAPEPEEQVVAIPN
ncbi:HD-GYP domain-containing protein [Oceanospirillum sp.]|uniref:HD-GYP domain-containing protein n=1 Tax=Oceanospirillum sp. TaxID=2021254 RepID=UPI003A92069C